MGSSEILQLLHAIKSLLLLIVYGDVAYFKGLTHFSFDFLYHSFGSGL